MVRPLNCIVAVSQNMGIGKNGNLPWPPLRYLLSPGRGVEGVENGSWRQRPLIGIPGPRRADAGRRRGRSRDLSWQELGLGFILRPEPGGKLLIYVPLQLPG